MYMRRAALTQNERKGKLRRESKEKEMGQVKLKSKRLSTLLECLDTVYIRTAY